MKLPLWEEALCLVALCLVGCEVLAAVVLAALPGRGPR